MEVLRCGITCLSSCTHSSILAWRIRWTVWSMGLQKVGHDRANFTFRKRWTILDLGAREMESKNLQFQPIVNPENPEQINWKLQYSIIGIIREKCKYMYTREWKVKVKVVQLCPTVCDPMDYTVHRILQARILEWVTFPFCRGSSQPRDRTQVSRIAGGFFTNWAIREA